MTFVSEDWSDLFLEEGKLFIGKFLGGAERCDAKMEKEGYEKNFCPIGHTVETW